MIGKCLSFGYRIRRPRVFSENDLSLIRYKKELKSTRRGILAEAIRHEHQYEDMFLENRKQLMLEKHRKNQTDYRTQIITNGFRLAKDIQIWKTRDQNKKLRLEGQIHKENLKVMNKDRIIKILNYESDNYWLSPDNLEQRLLEESIFPEYVGSTEHYHQLTEEALSYERLDFQGLQKINHDEVAVKFKNKLLIPIYNEVVKQVKKVKSNQLRDNDTEYKNKVDRINSLYTMPEFKAQKQSGLSKAKSAFQNKRKQLLKKMEDPDNREAFIKEKIVDIRNLLFFWKKYARVLNLTSMEINLLRQKSNIESGLSEVAARIAAGEGKLKKETERERVLSRISEQNTGEEDDIDMRTFLDVTDTKPASDNQLWADDVKIGKLNNLLDTEETIVTQLTQQESKAVGNDQAYAELLQDLVLPPVDTHIPQEERFKENSSVLIQSWKKLTKDPELKKLLDEVGETHVEQSSLFWKVFSMH